MEKDDRQIVERSTTRAWLSLAQVCRELFPDAEVLCGSAEAPVFHIDVLCPRAVGEEVLELLGQPFRASLKTAVPFTEHEMLTTNALELFATQGSEFTCALLEHEEKPTVSVWRFGQDSYLGKGRECNGEEACFAQLLHFEQSDSARFPKQGSLLRIWGCAFSEKKALKQYVKQWSSRWGQRFLDRGMAHGLWTAGSELDGLGVTWSLKGLQLRHLLRQLFWKECSSERYVGLDGLTPEGDEGAWERTDQRRLLSRAVSAADGRPLPLPLRLASLIDEAVDSEHERALGQDALASTPLALVLCEKTELERELISCLQSVQKTINILKFKGSYSLFLPSSKSGQCAFERDALLQLMEKLGLVGVEVHEATGRALRIEARVEDALGRRWPFSYVELDPPLAKAFGLHQKAGLGKMTKLNAIVWRLFPSVEALIALLLEREEGPWELEIAPEQLRVIPKESAQVDYAATVLQDLRERGLRATLDARDIPFKQRMYQSTRDWVPYVLLLGPPERATETLSMRSFTGEVTKELDLDTFVARMRDSGWCRSISEGRLRGDKNEDAN